MRKYRIILNQENNLWYLESKLLWFKWKCVLHDSNYRILRAKAGGYFFNKANVKDFNNGSKGTI